jgi:hypothetical protein
MNHISIDSVSQASIHVQSQIDEFFNRFRIATIFRRCGLRKRHGYSVRSLTQAIFTLPFIGKNFFRGIVINPDVAFGKDAAYQLLKATTYNWRKALLRLAVLLYSFFNRLTDDEREAVLIIDDSTYDRSRSKMVELLSRVHDHATGRFLKGFRMLAICWSDGVSCLPLDFALLSSADAKKRLCDNHKILDKRCCAYRRRKEAMAKATQHLEAMVKRTLAAGIQAKYLLMDSWFTLPATVDSVAKHIDIIGMVKKTPKIHYLHDGHWIDLMAIYRQLKKRRGRARILASTMVRIKDGRRVKLVFVRDKRKKDWLALLATDIGLNDEDVIRIYGKRWDIEVFFKMAKQHLKLAKEIQCRDFDALIAHTSIVFMRYMFIVYQCRCQSDHRTFGDLFYRCCSEVDDISFIEALYRVLSLAVDQIRKIGSFCEKTASAFFDAIIDTALQCVGLSKNNLIMKPES